MLVSLPSPSRAIGVIGYRKIRSLRVDSILLVSPLNRNYQKNRWNNGLSVQPRSRRPLVNLLSSYILHSYWKIRMQLVPMKSAGLREIHHFYVIGYATASNAGRAKECVINLRGV